MSARRFPRFSVKTLSDPRWPALRLQALRRDGFACVECGARGRLEVDPIKRVRDAPELRFELTNLQSLCGRCHSRKTHLEVGLPQLSPERRAWRDAVRALTKR
jgi:5-methylcytosine-specific restriction endonuclease McrA